VVGWFGLVGLAVPAHRGERLVECRRRLRQDWELERHVVSEHAAWHAAGIASDG
jgi:hypothetical protein